MSHSKRNTSRPVFTAHERALAKSAWSAGSARLGRDAFLPFGSCGLCLEIARTPVVACPRGDLFCRECAVANLLAQKKELRRAEKRRKGEEAEEGRRRTEMEKEEKIRAVRDFERTQVGLEEAATRKPGRRDSKEEAVNGEPPETETREAGALVVAGVKRRFELDDEELLRNMAGDRAKARKAIEDEKAAKQKLPSFWTPSLTPDVKDTQLALVPHSNSNNSSSSKDKKTTTHPSCPSATPTEPHTLSLHKLIDVSFDEETEPSSREKQRKCPSCRKTLSNALKPVLAKRCGHVVCLGCAKQFLLPSKERDLGPVACFSCDEPIAMGDGGAGSGLPPGLVALRSEGTGFSATGANTVEKSGVAFQC